MPLSDDAIVAALQQQEQKREELDQLVQERVREEMERVVHVHHVPQSQCVAVHDSWMCTS